MIKSKLKYKSKLNKLFAYKKCIYLQIYIINAIKAYIFLFSQ